MGGFKTAIWSAKKRKKSIKQATDIATKFDNEKERLLVDSIQTYVHGMELLDVHTNGSVLILIIGSSTVESMVQLLASKILISECHRDRA